MAKDYTERLDETIKGLVDQNTLDRFIRLTIANIGPAVTWDHLEAYLASKISADDEIFDNLHATIFALFQQSETSEVPLENTLHKLTFNDPQTANAFLAFTQHTFPLINSEYPQLSCNEIILTDDQLFFCRLGAKLKTGDLPSDFLSDYFLKTLRADENDFSDKFISSLFPNTNGTRRLQNLRPKTRSAYTIAGDGTIISRTVRATLGTSQKVGYTQIQSTTLLDTKAVTSPFGFSKARAPKLYGILTHDHDVIINRLLLNDGGTVSRPFDAEAEEPATRKISGNFKAPGNELLFHSSELQKFKSENLQARLLNSKTNEVLARMRFNIYRSIICICSDTLDSRLLAHDFSCELLEYFSDYAKENGAQLNPKYRLPILFYVKKTDLNIPQHIKSTCIEYEAIHNIFKLTRKMRKKDMEAATMIHTSACKDIVYNPQSYEFLLGLDSISPNILLQPGSEGIPLALRMLRKGCTRMLLRLIRPSRMVNTDQNSGPLSEIVFNSLIADNAFQKNDTLISHLIMAEAFTLADKIITATKSDKNELNIEENDGTKTITVKLIDHIACRGNPRHFHYMDLDETLLIAAKKNS